MTPCPPLTRLYKMMLLPMMMTMAMKKAMIFKYLMFKYKKTLAGYDILLPH